MPTLTELKDDDCRYPTHGDRPPFTFCGLPRTEGSSYCPEHRARCGGGVSKPINVHPSETVVRARGKAA